MLRCLEAPVLALPELVAIQVRFTRPVLDHLIVNGFTNASLRPGQFQA